MGLAGVGSRGSPLCQDPAVCLTPSLRQIPLDSIIPQSFSPGIKNEFLIKFLNLIIDHLANVSRVSWCGQGVLGCVAKLPGGDRSAASTCIMISILFLATSVCGISWLSVRFSLPGTRRWNSGGWGAPSTSTRNGGGIRCGGVSVCSSSAPPSASRTCNKK